LPLQPRVRIGERRVTLQHCRVDDGVLGDVMVPFQAVYVAWVLWAVPDTLALLRTHTRRRRHLAGSTRTPVTR
jgi:hypothetical protein